MDPNREALAREATGWIDLLGTYMQIKLPELDDIIRHAEERARAIPAECDHVRDVELLRTIVATLQLEVAILRLGDDETRKRLDRLERRGGGR